MSNDVLGASGEDNLGLVIDFTRKIQSKAISPAEAKSFLRREDPWWSQGFIQAQPFNPRTFIGNGWSIKEQDERSLVLSEIHLSKVALVSCLRVGESSITGEVRLKRLREAGLTCLDARFFLTLYTCSHLIPKDWHRYQVCFDGTEVHKRGGYQHTLCLYKHGSHWRWYIPQVNETFLTNSVSAVLAA